MNQFAPRALSHAFLPVSPYCESASVADNLLPNVPVEERPEYWTA